MSAVPSAIGNERQALRVEWRDGRVQRFAHAQLRRACPCSQCRAFRLRGSVPLVSDAVRVVGIEAQGYGVQLQFSDGHDRGIFPWAYLASLTASSPVGTIPVGAG